MTHEHARAVVTGATGWRTPRRSQGQNTCVELVGARGWVGVRDTKLGAASPVLAVSAACFAAFVAELPQR